MRSVTFVVLAVLGTTGCASGGDDVLRIPGRSPDVVVVDDDDREGRGRRGGARSLNVPKGHYPPPGECRLWYVGRPPGQQPPPARCERLIGRVPRGAFILYNDRAWDADYDWGRHARSGRGRVPDIIVRLTDRRR